jgi:hypothetical protein
MVAIQHVMLVLLVRINPHHHPLHVYYVDMVHTALQLSSRHVSHAPLVHTRIKMAQQEPVHHVQQVPINHLLVNPHVLRVV